MSTLHNRMLAAHAAGDLPALVALYSEAAATTADVDSVCFFLTHAYVFALELGDSRAAALRARLICHGREIPDQSDMSACLQETDIVYPTLVGT